MNDKRLNNYMKRLAKAGGKKRWESATIEEKHAHAMLMLRAREQKRQKVVDNGQLAG